MVGRTIDAVKWLLDQERDKEWEVKPYRKARTNRQNAYYWQLLTQLADCMRMSKAEAHNQMLRDYGQLYMIDGQPVEVMVPDTEAGERSALRSETYHLRPTSKIAGGRGCRIYFLLRGSHEYNTAEMSYLVDGLVQEAKQLGIETLTPDELEKLRMYDRRKENDK